ncbi:MAG: hypothetical protein SFX73_07510 [Kofleriaceae bacterium]|nr:hypothetical protein [Kofleriaceae bacterium]
MAVVAQAAPQTRMERRTYSRLRRRRDDLWIGSTALIASMLALPLAQNSWHCPEVAATLAVSATAMLAGQRWAIALVVLAELLLLPTLLPRAFFFGDGDTWMRVTGLVAVSAVVPGTLAMKRAAAAFVLLTGWRRTQITCRRFHWGLVTAGLLAAVLPLL